MRHKNDSLLNDLTLPSQPQESKVAMTATVVQPAPTIENPKTQKLDPIAAAWVALALAVVAGSVKLRRDKKQKS